MISSTQSGGIADTVRSSVRAAFHAGITTITLPGGLWSDTARLHVDAATAAGGHLDGGGDDRERHQRHGRREGVGALRRALRAGASVGTADGVVQRRLARQLARE